MSERLYEVDCGPIHRTILASDHARATLLAISGHVAETGRVSDLDRLDPVLTVSTANGEERWVIPSVFALGAVIAMLRPNIDVAVILVA